MGWFWNTPPQSKPSTPPPPPPATQAPSSSSSTSAPETDPEIQKFLSFFQDEANAIEQQQQHQQQQTSFSSSSFSSTQQSTTTTTTTTSSLSNPSLFSWRSSPSAAHNDTTSPTQHQPTAAAAAADPYAEGTVAHALLPTTMSCRQAFDLAWGCQSPVGQWNAIYRHGSVRPCSELWDDFWFCMRTKGYGKELKEKAIREHYRGKESRKYGPGFPSSEDVWQSRDRLVEKGTVFNATFEDDEGVSDADLSLAQMQRRRMVQEAMAAANASRQA